MVDARRPVNKGWTTEGGAFDTTTASSAIAVTTVAGIAHLVDAQRLVNKG